MAKIRIGFWLIFFEEIAKKEFSMSLKVVVVM